MKNKYNVKEFDRPMLVSYKDIKKYDVLDLCFGDELNTIKGVLLNIKFKQNTNNEVLKIEYDNMYGNVDTCYAFLKDGDYKFNVLGKAKPLQNEDVFSK